MPILIILIVVIAVVVYLSMQSKSDYNANNPVSQQVSSSQPNKNSKYKEISIPERQEPEPKFLSSKDIPPQTDYEAYFRDGSLFNVNPRNKKISLDEDRQTAYHARYIISDGKRYDLENPDDIKNIAIPNFTNSDGAFLYTTRDLSYILKMRVGAESRPHLAVPLAYKVANLMIASPIGWSKKDYYRPVIQLWSIGEVAYGDHLLNELKKHLPSVAAKDEVKLLHTNSFVKALNYAKTLNTDYIEIGYLGAVCPECALYQNRIYSISGNDNKFPKLPDFIVKEKGLHCGPSYHAVLYHKGYTITQYLYSESGNVTSKEVDALIYSNRPFIDDRSEIEKQNYEDWKEKREKQQNKDAQYYSREHWISEYLNHVEYENIVKLLGSNAPKSYSGYMRMKKNNTVNFQKIAKLAEENGFKIN